MPKFIAKIDRSFLIEYPQDGSYFRQNYKPRVMMPVVRYPNGIPEPDEPCLIVVSIEKRVYNNVIRKHEAGPGSYKVIVRVFKLSEKPYYPIKFVLKAARIAKYMRLNDVYKVIQAGITKFEKLLVYTSMDDQFDLSKGDKNDEQKPVPNMPVEREQNRSNAKTVESNT